MRTSLTLGFAALALVCWAGVSGADQSQDLQSQVNTLTQQMQALQEQLGKVQADLAAAKAATPAPAKPGAGGGTVVTKLADKLTIGGDIRLRYEGQDNAFDFAGNDSPNNRDNWRTYRLRSRIFFDAELMDNMRGYVRLTNEFRAGDSNWDGSTAAGFGSGDHDNKDVVIDNMYIELKEFCDKSLTLRLGRQDIVFGEGFVMLDGTPYDGSTTISFDAARATWKMDDQTTFDIFAAQPQLGYYTSSKSWGRADAQDVYGVYVTSCLNEHLKWEPYFMYKEKRNDYFFTSPPGGAGSFVLMDPKMDTVLLGTRASGKVTDGLSYTGEVGKEWGEIQDLHLPYDPAKFIGEDRERDAWAGYLRGTYTWGDCGWKPALSATYTYLSGDDPKTKEFEGWDDFYGDWPKYSEFFIYTTLDFFNDKGKTPGIARDLGTWTNMNIPEVKLELNPSEKVKLSLRYLYYYADQKTGLGDGRTFGSNPQALLEYTFNKVLSGHLLGEYFKPGDYYDEDHREGGYFLRGQLMLQF